MGRTLLFYQPSSGKSRIILIARITSHQCQLCVCVCVHYVHMYTYVYIHIVLELQIYIQRCVYICMYIHHIYHIYIYIYHLYIYIYLCIYIYKKTIYIYIDIIEYPDKITESHPPLPSTDSRHTPGHQWHGSMHSSRLAAPLVKKHDKKLVAGW